jgi:cytochrome b involved in lipid metabolism
MSGLPEYTAEQVRAHSKEEDCWIVWYGGVYHLPRDFILSHPGGPVLMDAAGRDGTIMFEDNAHPDSARELMKEFKIGVLKK